MQWEEFSPRIRPCLCRRITPRFTCGLRDAATVHYESKKEERKTGAGDRFRTDDLVLGKHTLYQLSYTRSQVFVRRAADTAG
jgi:hypothetical protein